MEVTLSYTLLLFKATPNICIQTPTNPWPIFGYVGVRLHRKVHCNHIYCHLTRIEAHF